MTLSFSLPWSVSSLHLHQPLQPDSCTRRKPTSSPPFPNQPASLKMHSTTIARAHPYTRLPTRLAALASFTFYIYIQLHVFSSDSPILNLGHTSTPPTEKTYAYQPNEYCLLLFFVVSSILNTWWLRQVLVSSVPSTHYASASDADINERSPLLNPVTTPLCREKHIEAGGGPEIIVSAESICLIPYILGNLCLGEPVL